MADGTAGDDAEVDDDLAPPIEDGVQERTESADLAGRSGEGAVEHVEDAADEDDDPAQRPALPGDEQGAAVVMPKPMSVSASGVRPSRPMARAIGSRRP